tara:strand:+ start:46 stop:795 length:750 start_codon:yes stop_codon:yes gene_type:complete
MSNFKFLKISKFKKLRYLSINHSSDLYVVFLHGFMSDINGEKPKNFLKYCKKRKLGFLAIEYSGHGKSSGKFTKGNISKWTKEVKISINKIIKKKNFIIIGSSIGSWLALNQFKFFKEQIIGFMGIGSAPEFLDRLMWKKFSKKIKKEIIIKKIYQLKHGEYKYPITYQIIKDGKKNKVLKKKYKIEIPVTMVHGSRDEVVPVSFSRKILNNFTKARKKLLIIKNGDHSLSNQINLKKINKELDKILNF